MKAKPALPERVRSMEGLGVTGWCLLTDNFKPAFPRNNGFWHRQWSRFGIRPMNFKLYDLVQGAVYQDADLLLGFRQPEPVSYQLRLRRRLRAFRNEANACAAALVNGMYDQCSKTLNCTLVRFTNSSLLENCVQDLEFRFRYRTRRDIGRLCDA